MKKLDHVVITVADVARTISFYEKLGFLGRSGNGRHELFAGDFKLNVHELGRELSPHAAKVMPGSADLCFEIEGDISALKKDLEEKGLTVELGLVPRSGVKGAMTSLYLRDPDGNLLEFCSYQ